MVSLPYFDLILAARARSGPAAKVFERFVHWGYWEEPSRAGRDVDELSRAMERLNGELLSGAGLADGQSVLDCGCGFGGTLATINESRQGMELVGLNIDPRQLRVAEEQVRARPGNRIRFLEADACRIPLPDAAFDRVLAVECIFHFPSRFAFLQEAARLLKPGGRLTLSDFVPWDAGRGGFGRAWLERIVLRGYGTMSSGWPDGDYRRMAAACGLELSLDRDVTRQTLPTYAALLGLLPRVNKRVRRTTRMLQWLSRVRLLSYRIVGFTRRAAGTA